MNLSLKISSFYRKMFVASFSLLVLGLASLSYAQELNPLNTVNDFVLEPGKVEVFVNPGDSITKTITVTNRASTKVSFKIEIEDFIGSDDQDKPVILLGNEKSPYSFKDNVVPSVNTFTLEANTNLTIPVKINVPANAQPGGFYTSVLVSNQPSVDEASQSSVVKGGTKVISRIGTLFFIRVNGVTKESGSLEDLRVSAPTKDSSAYNFSILFKNDGNVHLVPYGWVTITDVFGKMVGRVPVDAYFAMPQSVRYRDVQWSAPFLFGKYEATVQLNRGYGSDLVDTKTISFWAVPLKETSMIVVGLIVLYMLYRFLSTRFKLVSRE